MVEEIEIEEEEQYDAADPQNVNNARKKEARLRQKRIDFMRSAMGDSNGRLYFYDLLMMGHFSEPTFTQGDAHATSFKEGERNFANRILFDINEAAPEMYMQLLTDGKTEK